MSCCGPAVGLQRDPGAAGLHGGEREGQVRAHGAARPRGAADCLGEAARREGAVCGSVTGPWVRLSEGLKTFSARRPTFGRVTTPA